MDCGARANVRGGVMQTVRRKKDAKARPAWPKRTARAREFEAAIIGMGEDNPGKLDR